ncbi:hypothetical protein FBY33_0782 [Arthrobacter sp. SLBN-112]|jgi:hypothetical protein|nr:hypothetical protein FBY33_0782 [Arthrobacter sp. SLBN-112]
MTNAQGSAKALAIAVMPEFADGRLLTKGLVC